MIPSYTEGNPKVVWESVELGVFPVISNPLTFHGYAHEKYPFRFDPDNFNEFWEVIFKAIDYKDSLRLEDYFEISSHLNVRKEYNRSYNDILGESLVTI